jgi:hypothetical protein
MEYAEPGGRFRLAGVFERRLPFFLTAGAEGRSKIFGRLDAYQLVKFRARTIARLYTITVDGIRISATGSIFRTFSVLKSSGVTQKRP